MYNGPKLNFCHDNKAWAKKKTLTISCFLFIYMGATDYRKRKTEIYIQVASQVVKSRSRGNVGIPIGNSLHAQILLLLLINNNNKKKIWPCLRAIPTILGKFSTNISYKIRFINWPENTMKGKKKKEAEKKNVISIFTTVLNSHLSFLFSYFLLFNLQD